jgi:signal transduction histidine kinase
MTATTLADELRGIYLFNGIADDDLAALADVGEVVSFVPGDNLFQQGAVAEWWWVLLEGKLEFRRRAGREDMVVATMENPGQWAGGFTAWMPEAGYTAAAWALTEGRMFRVSGEELGTWARRVIPLGAHFATGVFQTVRVIEMSASQREAMVALGTLAAGLAHELNNPAAATARSVDAMRDVTGSLLSSLEALAAASEAASQFDELDWLRKAVGKKANEPPSVVAEREDDLTDWLDDHDVEDGWKIAPVLAEACADVEWCEQVADALPNALGAGLEWVASTLSLSTILDEMQEATGRISALVNAVRSYSQLDRASVQLIDVTDGLESTLVIMRHELGGITVEREFAADLPRIEAYAAQLNQVWTNLIDNAIDAMDGSGTLTLRTRGAGDCIVVDVVDSGSGMSPDVQQHVFEPFFTTKDVGKGTGLGLDMSRRIVIEQHKGDIEISSRPGETIFSVRLPISLSDSNAG